MTEFQQALIALIQPFFDDDLETFLDESLITRTDKASHMDSGLSDTALAGLITAALNQGNLLSSANFPALVRAEQSSLQFFKTLFGFEYGHFTSGGTEANLEALWYARNAEPERRHVYGTAACHYSVQKACDLLGLQFQVIPSRHEIMVPAALQQACEKSPPLAIVLNAGTTSAGMLDPLETAIEIAHEYHAHCHIDAAWGGFLALDGQLPQTIQQADSLCFDPHKSLSQPKPCGLLLYQHAPINTRNPDSPYLDAEPALRLSGSYGGERFLGLWLGIQADRGESLRQLVRQQLHQAAVFSHWLKTQQLPCLAGPAAVVCFQLPAETGDPVVMGNQFSTTHIDGEHWFRAVFSRPDIDAQVLIRAVAAVL